MKRELVLRILDQSHELVSSARIEGSSVYSRQGGKLGVIHSVMLNKKTGRAAYVVMLLDDQNHPFPAAHPLPWPMLHYDTERGGYVVDLSRELLAEAPSFALDSHDRPREVTPEAIRAFYGPKLLKMSEWSQSGAMIGWPS